MNRSRRKFIKNTAVGISGLTLGGMSMTKKSYANIKGANDRLNVAVVGLGRRAHAWPGPIALPESNARLLYLCDVMESRREAAAERFSEVIGYTPTLENDVRNIYDDEDVDAIIIATPDHWHTPGACYGVQAGKHVYVEKPGSHNPRESELIVEFQKEYGKLIQMGNQSRSSAQVLEGISLLHDGIIGDTYQAVASYYNARGYVPVPVKSPVPEGLDWELFQGPAPRRDYRHDTWDYNWHWYEWDYGTAEAGNNAIHAVDIARAALNVEYPERVDTNAFKIHYNSDGWSMYDTMDATLRFPGNKTIKWDCKSRNRYNTYGSQGPIIYGTEGTMTLRGPGGYSIYDRSGELIRDGAAEENRNDSNGRSVVEEHVLNFFNSIRGTDELNSPIADGQRSTLLCHMMNISSRLGRGFDVNTQSGHIFDKEAMALWGREYEPGWEPTL